MKSQLSPDSRHERRNIKNINNEVEHCLKTLTRLLTNANDAIQTVNRSDIDKSGIMREVLHNYATVTCIKKTAMNLLDIASVAHDKYHELADEYTQKTKELVSNSWADITESDDNKRNFDRITEGNIVVNDPLITNYKPDTGEKTETYKYEANNIQNRFPYTDDIKKIPQAIWYFEGDQIYEAGLYCCIAENIYAKIPTHMTIVSEDILRSKHASIRCIHGDECKQCGCTFAHPGQQYVRVGYSSRCPSKKCIGNTRDFHIDIESVNEQDVRILGMHTLNDLYILSSMASKCVKPNHILRDLDICDGDKMYGVPI